jgi:SAM-dependent methyltransferase
MSLKRQIIESGPRAWPWWVTPAGRQLVQWEQAWADAALADTFGFHAVQLGLPSLRALQANRISNRWLAVQAHPDAEPGTVASPANQPVAGYPDAPSCPAALHCDFDALPFPGRSLDLVVLAHALEQARDPHLTLAEVERVLVPEGRLLIFGLNPASLWAWRRNGKSPGTGQLIGYRRLRDWLRLLSFEVEAARFGGFRPPLASADWLDRLAWMERTGARWWPIFGAVYAIQAVKRVRGMRLVGLTRRQARYASAPRPAVTVRQRRQGPPLA